MAEEYYAELTISSLTLTPDEISEMLGMKYDHCHVKGNNIGKSILKAPKHSWMVYSRIPRDNDIDEHITDLLERISPISDKLKNIVSYPDIEILFYCVIYTKNRQDFGFNYDQVQAIADIGASINVDLYLLPEDDEED